MSDENGTTVSSSQNSGGFLAGLNSVVSIVGETFSNVWNATHGVPKSGGATTPAPTPSSAKSKSNTALIVGGAALLGLGIVTATVIARQ